MQYSCYHYYSESNQKIIIFIRNKDILNIYIGCNIHNINKLDPLFVITEKELKKYPYLYKIYFASILLTKNCNKLDYNSIFYSVNKSSIYFLTKRKASTLSLFFVKILFYERLSYLF